MQVKEEENYSKERRRAAIYVRMSTDHQKYSTENQEAAMRDYATRHQIDLVKTYTDGGRSGLSFSGRSALQTLISDVQAGTTEFSVILILDVTRWGRYQDVDESAYYEFICRRAGYDVQYVAEQFTNDGSLQSNLMKNIKRSMAGEYSRELSVKVFAGQCRLIEKGYRQGGPAGYGLRRQLIDEHGERKSELKRGEHKSLQTDRVTALPTSSMVRPVTLRTICPCRRIRHEFSDPSPIQRQHVPQWVRWRLRRTTWIADPVTDRCLYWR